MKKNSQSNSDLSKDFQALLEISKGKPKSKKREKKSNGELDHNNMPGRLKTKQELLTVKSMTRPLRREGVRKYPGDMKTRDILPTSPVAHFRTQQLESKDDLSFSQSFKEGTIDPLTFQNDENMNGVKPDELVDFNSTRNILEKETFLHIDQSKLPLEMFDDYSFQEIDKDPQAWVEEGAQGETSYYLNGEWRWRNCEVIGYNQETSKFIVKFQASGREKEVRRMNIRFNEEDNDLWEARRAAAEEGRRSAKSLMRYDYYLDQQSNDSVRPIQQGAVRTIHMKIADGLPHYLPYPEPQSYLGVLLQKLTGEIVRGYFRSMKKASFHYNINISQELKQEYIDLKLPPIPPKQPAPYYGKLMLPLYPFFKNQNKTSNAHISSIQPLLGVYMWLHSQWNTTSRDVRLLDTHLQSLSLPLDLSLFHAHQTEACSLSFQLLSSDLRRGFIEHFVDNLQDVFDFFQSDMDMYLCGKLFSVFRAFDLRLREMLKHSIIESVNEWKEFIAKFTSPFVQDGTKEETFGRSSDPRKSEEAFTIASHPPLFNVSLALKDENVVLLPSRDDINTVMVGSLGMAISSIKEITSVDTDLMSLLHLPSIPILDVMNGDEVLELEDSFLQNSMESVEKAIDIAMEEPQMFCDMFNSYNWLLALNDGMFLEEFLNQDPVPTLQDWKDQLWKFQTAIDELQKISFKDEDFPLVRISTSDAKDQLIQRATQFRDSMLEQLILDARDENIDVINKYENILERIAIKPKDERELAELRDFIEQSKETVLQLSSRSASAKEKLETLNSFFYRLSLDDQALSWSTLEYPGRIEIAAKKAEESLQADKIKMMDKLAVEKEKFDEYLEDLEAEVKNVKGLSNYEERENNTNTVNQVKESIAAAKEKADDFNMREEVFGFPPTEYPILGTFEEDLESFYKLWNMVTDFYNSMNDWLNGPFIDLEGKKIENDVTDWWKSSYRLAKVLSEEFPEAGECAQCLRNDTTEFKTHLPVIQSLASPALRKRHWARLSAILDHDVEPDDELTLQALLDMDAASHIDEIQEVNMCAEKEFSLERSLEGMKQEWLTIEFEVIEYKETGTYVVRGVDEIITLLDDHIVKTQTMRGSPYIKPIETPCKEWEHKLKYAQTLIDQWIMCQKTWMYLEPIFGSEDIIKQLPTEARRFQGVDALWRKTMTEANEDPIFMMQAAPDKKLNDKFAKANEKLEEIQKGLADYLELKRLYFARFFFLSNDELLEILSQTKQPKAVNPHLGKCFEGVNNVTFESDLKISEMISAQNEMIPLNYKVDPESPDNKGNVEKWLLQLEAVQWESIKTVTENSLAQYPDSVRTEWCLDWPAQVVLAVTQIFWTSGVTECLRNGGGQQKLTEYADFLTDQLKDIVNKVRSKLTKLQRSTFGALTTLDVHARDVTLVMAKNDVVSVDDFEWMSQLRYYWEESWKDGQAVKQGDETIVARIVNARCLYGYEYLGNTMRLVITPLTDRCYRTMIGAIDLLYGGAPEGPAGTGKTETVKDLSKAAAIQCVVFNCSDGLDYLAMAKFFKGLASAGSWCCFDEFNRINLEVLSVIAQQILTINQGKKEGKTRFFFEGTNLTLNHNANVFITMNPGYAGRQELPDNLKALFRPCAMMVPDYALIGEIRLYSFGFENARDNARKLVRVLQLSSEQLSSQKHYDYGMRAVNTILVAAGNLRQQLGDDPEWTEHRIVYRAIIDVNLPKFLIQDIPLFENICSDLFPGISLPDSDYGDLLPCLYEVCETGVNIAPGKDFVLEPVPTFIKKISQLYEMVLVRHGIMIVGETCSGKTVGIHGLAQAMGLAKEKGNPHLLSTDIHTMNPKSVTCDQLYGNFDENTHEWSDGILAIIFRQCAKDTSGNRQWIKFDGPVDAIWIESMNTVLDDNKKLCLTSGEIIKMSDLTSMMFEAEDLEEASPATVSRVGMIFCESRNIGWRPLRNMFLKKLDSTIFDEEILSTLSTYFDWLFPPLQYFVDKYCKVPTSVTNMELLLSLTRLLNCFFEFNSGPPNDMISALEGSFLFSLTWSVGGCVDSEGRKKFSDFLQVVLKNEDDLKELPEYKDFLIKNRDYLSILGGEEGLSELEMTTIPDLKADADGTVPLYFDFVFETSNGKWKHWLDGESRFVIEKDATFNSIVVPTVDTIRNDWLLTLLLESRYHVLFTGDTGTGKSVTVKNKLMHGVDETYTNISLNFSARTSANQTQDLVDSKLDKRRKGVFGPPLGSTCIIFVDDLSMPKKEQYGAQPPIELLRQWMDHCGWYDRKESSFRNLVDIVFFGAMGPPGGGRTKITQRYIRHFNLINMVPFSDQSLTRVFGTIVDWFLSKGFGGGINQLGGPTVQGTIQVYNLISATLLPTPMKSHYTFNLRDISKVFQGVAQGTPDMIKEKSQFVKLWVHECLRVFYDRLVSQEDRCWFNEMIKEVTKENFNLDWNRIQEDEEVPITFGNYINPRAVNKLYQEVEDTEILAKVMNDYLDDYNAMSSKPMDLVLFQNAIEHVSRISRVINQPYGNALLVGVGGSGRKSATNLAVFIADYELFQIEISKSYGVVEWREDIKGMMMKASLENKPTVFLLDDTQIVLESFLEDVNGILNTGEVANLLNDEDMMIIQDALTKPMTELGMNAGNPNEMYTYFVSRCRENLHVVLTMSPIGQEFRTRLRMFPSLVNCCTIDWFTNWPEDALRHVANFFLDGVEMEESEKEGVVDVCVDMQRRVTDMSDRYLAEMRRHFYVTPTSYLELISTFKGLLQNQRDIVIEQKARYDNGLSKLRETAEQVDVMQKELTELKPKLVVAKAETEELLVQIEKDQKVADERKGVVEAEETICNKQKEEATELKESCEADLAEALPALEGAIKALKSLSKGDITEVKSMKKPPSAVKLTMEAVCIMMEVKPQKVKNEEGKKVDDYWVPSQKHLLGDPRFLQRLFDYDKDNIPPEIIEKATVYANMEEFTPTVVERGSKAAAGICKWVHAMVVYDRVARVVAPKRAALAQAEGDLAEATEALNEKRAVLQEILDNLAILEADLHEAETKKKLLEDQYEDCSVKLQRAEQLMSGLGGEKDRWGEMSIQLQDKYDNVTGDILLSAGVVAYLGAFISQYRETAVSEWAALLQQRGITCSSNFSLRDTLGDPVQIRSWVINKLPNDAFSIENSIMLFTSKSRWPLMIDPQGQANRWVKKMEEENQLKIVKQNQPTFVRTIENAIQFGAPVLLENVPEFIDPILDSVLLKQIIRVGSMCTIRLGDNTVEYDPKFRLYITTKLANPHYPPELCVKVNLLNFMATEEGLQDQMLGVLVTKEKPELEAQREQLVLEDAENKKQLKEIEDKILYLLKHAEGNILDDSVLIDALGDSKKMGRKIEEKVKIAEQTQARIANVREGYNPVAFQSSQLFFCISDLSNVDPMYQYSLEWFISLFELAVDNAPQSTVLDERLESLKSTFLDSLYRNVCRSLFEKDKLLFSFLLTLKVLLGRKDLNPLEIRFFLQGNTTMDLPEPNPAPEWLSEKSWGDILALGNLHTFSSFVSHFKTNLSDWKSVSDAPENPSAVLDQILDEDEFDDFQKLCILRCLRLEAVGREIQSFVKKKMGGQYITPPPFDLASCYADSKCDTPLIFVLTPGADPMTQLYALADSLGFTQKLTSLSLGQGQGPKAERALEEASTRGTWVCLQNCHLSISWLPTLEKICEELSPENLHPEFRLWLTSEPSPYFPAYILQNGVKMTNEPPKGMRANLIGSFQTIDDEWFDGCVRKSEFKTMLYSLCFFHASVIERRKFGALGWNIQYVFSTPDLRITMDQLRIFLDSLKPEDPIPYPALSYLAGECNYGGRVTDDKDRRCIMNILSDFYTGDIHNEDYTFSPSGTYILPDNSGTLVDFKEFISDLPINEGPEVFGLSDNANITCELQETNTLLITALSLQPRATGGEGKSWDEQLSELSRDIEDKLPPQFDLERALLDFPVLYEESMNTVLTQELLRFNRLTERVKATLKDVQKAIKGEVVMSSELEDMGNSIVMGQVPELWSAVGYPSLKPLGSWTQDLLERLVFLGDWMNAGTSPCVYWISGFFFTQAFITGTLQNYARKHNIPIDEVAFDFKVMTEKEMKKADDTKPEDGAYIRGLFMEGAKWDGTRRAIGESDPRVLFVSMPYIHLTPNHKDLVPVVKGVAEHFTGDPLGTAHVYMCPVYKTSLRQGALSTTGHSTNFVMFIRIPMSKEHDQKHWIKRGVAMLTQLDS